MTSVSELAPAVESPVESEVLRFDTVDGCVVFDLPDAEASGGGTRLASDIDEREVRLLARAMTYKLAAVGLRVGGAKIGLRAEPSERDTVVDRFRTEIEPLLASGRLMTGPDLGTYEADFRGLPIPGGSDGIAAQSIENVPAEEYLTGFAAAVAIQAALGTESSALDGRTLALEGFGKVASGVAREIARRGGRIVAVSTVEGCVLAPSGGELNVERLLEARASWGDRLVYHLGDAVLPRDALWRVHADVMVPGARPAVVDAARAARLQVNAVVPFANAPYTAGALEVLARRRVAAHADFIASAGGAMAYLDCEVARATSAAEALRALEQRMLRTVREAMEESDTPYRGAVRCAQRFLASWRPPGSLLPAPPLAMTAY
jgi:glutamate dehydrogenase (NAD(P)+)